MNRVGRVSRSLKTAPDPKLTANWSPRVQRRMTNPEPSPYDPVDERTFRAFQAGDQQAATALVRHYYSRLVGYLTLMCGTVELAEEVAQETFLKAYQEREKLKRPESVAPWLFITARRMVYRQMNRARTRSERSFAPEVLASLAEAVPASQENALRLEQLSRELETALAVLNETDRELVVLRYFSGLQIKEISATLKMPMGSVGVKLRRALDKMKTALNGAGFDYEDLQ